MQAVIEDNDKELEALQQEIAGLNRELLNVRMIEATTINPTPSTVSPTPTLEIPRDAVLTSPAVESTSTNASSNDANGNISAQELQRTLLVELAASVNSELTDAQALISSQQQELSHLETMKERCEAQEILIAHFRQIVEDLTGETKGQLEEANAVIEQQQQEMARLKALSNTFRSVFKELAGTVSDELTKANTVIPSQRQRIDDLEVHISELQEKLLGFQTVDHQDHGEGERYEGEKEDVEEEGNEGKEEGASNEEGEERRGTDLFSNDEAMPGSLLPFSPSSIAMSERAASVRHQGTPEQHPLPAGDSSPLSVEILDIAAQPKNVPIIDLTDSPPPATKQSSVRSPSALQSYHHMPLPGTVPPS